MENKKFNMCVNPKSVERFLRAVEKTKNSFHFKRWEHSYLEIKETDPKRPYPDQVWFTVTYSREFLIFQLGCNFVR